MDVSINRKVYFGVLNPENTNCNVRLVDYLFTLEIQLID